MRIIQKYIIPPAILLSLWFALKLTLDIPDFVLPSPIDVFHAFINSYGVIVRGVSITFGTILLGLILGTMMGFCASILLYYFPKTSSTLKPLLLFSQSMPSFTLAPLIILYCGFGLSSQLILMTLVLFFTITSSLTTGLEGTPRALLDLAQQYKFTRSQTLFHIKLPASFPHFASGLRLATAFAPVAAIFAEWMGASTGIGALILTSYTHVQIDLMFAAIMCMFVISLALYSLVGLILRGFKNYV